MILTDSIVKPSMTKLENNETIYIYNNFIWIFKLLFPR
jgi:hypothetical protein